MVRFILKAAVFQKREVECGIFPEWGYFAGAAIPDAKGASRDQFQNEPPFDTEFFD